MLSSGYSRACPCQILTHDSQTAYAPLLHIYRCVLTCSMHLEDHDWDKEVVHLVITPRSHPDAGVEVHFSRIGLRQAVNSLTASRYISLLSLSMWPLALLPRYLYL